MKKRIGQLVKYELRHSWLVLVIAFGIVALILSNLFLSGFFGLLEAFISPADFLVGIYESYMTTFTQGVAEIAPLFMVVSAGLGLIVSANLNKNEKKGREIEFLAAMPITKRQRFLVKYFTGLLSITGFYMVFSIVMILIRHLYSFSDTLKAAANASYLLEMAVNNVYILIIFLFGLYLTSAFAYTLAILMNNFVNNAFIAELVSAGLLLTPFVLINDTLDFCSKYLVNDEKITSVVVKIPEFFYVTNFVQYSYGNEYGYLCVLDNDWLKYQLITFVAIVLMFVIAFFVSSVRELANLDHVFSYKFVKYVIEVLVGFVISLTIVSQSEMREMKLITAVVVLVVIAGLCAYLVDFVIRRIDRR